MAIWTLNASPHFARSAGAKRCGLRPIPAWTVRHPSFPQLVQVAATDLIGDDLAPLRKIEVLKQIMREASKQVELSAQNRTADTCEERLSVSIKFHRALLEHDIDSVIRFGVIYPHLTEICPPGDRVDPHCLVALQLHIVDLARTDIQTRMDQLQALKHVLPDTDYAARKEHFLVRLQRLIPGKTSNSIDAVLNPEDNQVITDSAHIAEILTKHWQKVFSRKPCNERLMHTWLSEVGSKKFLPTMTQIIPLVNLTLARPLISLTILRPGRMVYLFLRGGRSNTLLCLFFKP
jgi:hypothetical protein